jgi:hypothetical protein
MLHLLNKSLNGRKSIDRRTNDRNGRREPSATTMINELDLASFPQFYQLNEDIRKLILSFIADAPLEDKVPGPIGSGGQPHHGYRPGSLMSSIPLVNSEFHQLSNLDYFWEPILRRQIRHKDNGILWIEGLCRLLPPNHPESIRRQQQQQQSTTTQSNVDDDTSNNRIITAVREHLQDQSLSYKQIYMKVLTTHIQFDAPIFIMPCHLRFGEAYGLHLFEPRYRIMIRDLMDQCANPEQASNGGKIQIGSRNGVQQPPLLIHACLGSRIAPGEHACIVQVVWCRTYEYGTADVRLLPVAWCRLDRIWVRPNAGHLFYAKAMRLPPSK